MHFLSVIVKFNHDGSAEDIVYVGIFISTRSVVGWFVMPDAGWKRINTVWFVGCWEGFMTI
jgi:hypothetical protein